MLSSAKLTCKFHYPTHRRKQKMWASRTLAFFLFTVLMFVTNLDAADAARKRSRRSVQRLHEEQALAAEATATATVAAGTEVEIMPTTGPTDKGAFGEAYS